MLNSEVLDSDNGRICGHVWAYWLEAAFVGGAAVPAAQCTSMRGAAEKVLSPVHTELLNVSEPAGVTHQAIMERLEGINLD